MITIEYGKDDSICTHNPEKAYDAIRSQADNGQAIHLEIDDSPHSRLLAEKLIDHTVSYGDHFIKIAGRKTVSRYDWRKNTLLETEGEVSRVKELDNEIAGYYLFIRAI